MADLQQIAVEVSQGIEGGFEHPKVMKLTSDLYVAPQMTDETLKELAAKGVKTVINLRFESEAGFADASKVLEEAGVNYVKFPMNGKVLTDELGDKLLAEIDAAAKPVVVHCKGMIRAAGIGLMHQLSRSQLSPEDLDERLRTIGLDPDNMASLKMLAQKYIQSKLEFASSLPEISQVSSDLFIGPQVTEAQIKELASKGVKTVINLRDPAEAGQVGLGVLANEGALVEAAGMTYVSIPTVANEAVPDATAAKIRDAFAKAEKPVLMHCRRKNRTSGVVEKIVS